MIPDLVIHVWRGVFLRIAELNGPFPWGLLVVRDHLSLEEVPEWTSADSLVVSAGTGLVCKVLHGQFGDVEVHVWDSQSKVAGYEIFNSDLVTETGIVVVGDIVGSLYTKIELKPGAVTVRILVNEGGTESDHVDIQLSESSNSWPRLSREV